MSVACQKQIAITVNTGLTVDAYWTLDEAGAVANRVDKVHGILLQPQGLNQITGAPALFSNGLAFIEAGAGSSLDTFANVGLKIQSSNGWSIFGWFKVLDWPVFPSYSVEKVFELFAIAGGAVDIIMTFDSFTQKVTFQFDDNAFASFFPADFTPVTGTWCFFHLFFDPVTTKVGYSINNGANVLGAAGAVYGANTNGELILSQNWALPDTATNSLLIDEVGLKLSRILTPAEVTFLYNGGAGRTWPL